ncbi:DUF4136 domain-containing protein [Thalassotalea montiporae]
MRISSLKRFFHFTKFTRRLCWFSAFLLLTACSSQPKIAIVKYQPIFDFSQVQSYGLYQRNDEFNDWQLISDSLRNGIELAIEQAMDSQGFAFKDSSEADVILTYYVVRRSARSFKTYNRGVNYCSYCLTNSKTGTRAERLDIKAGSLVIDVIQPKHRRSIWRTNYPLGLNEKDTSIEVNAKISFAVAAMLKQFSQTQQWITSHAT